MIEGGRRLRRALACVLASLVCSLVMPGIAAPAVAASTNPDCRQIDGYHDRADELMANQYTLGAFGKVTLPADLTWTEDPFHDANWQMQEHAFMWARDLLAAWLDDTANTSYLDRVYLHLQDWIHDNPRSRPKSRWAWNDMATAYRTIVMACVVDDVGGWSATPDWLKSGLLAHGRALADPAFYTGANNHAFNQAIALLEAGRVSGRTDWIDLAKQRINTFVDNHLDTQGVIDEQSMQYEFFNYGRYVVAMQRLQTAGLEPGPAFARVMKMPSVMAMGSLPTGTMEMLGDTRRLVTPGIRGTQAEFVATQGQSGPKPAQIGMYRRAGYLFVHSGWGETRPFTDETFMSAQWGAGMQLHGHEDGQAITLAAWGAPLLMDPGLYKYVSFTDRYRSFMKSRRAHNVVTVDGVRWTPSTPSSLRQYRVSPTYVDLLMRTSGYPGVTQDRRVTYSRRLDYVVVDDRMTSTTAHTYRQLWHLPERSSPVAKPLSVWTQRDGSNVLIRQLIGHTSARIVQGATSPVQGWLSYDYGKKLPAPVAEIIRNGKSVRYLTLIVPAKGKPSVRVSSVRTTLSGYTLVVTIGGRTERLVVSDRSISSALL